MFRGKGASGAWEAPPSEIRTLGGKGLLHTPLPDSPPGDFRAFSQTHPRMSPRRAVVRSVNPTPPGVKPAALDLGEYGDRYWQDFATNQTRYRAVAQQMGVKPMLDVDGLISPQEVGRLRLIAALRKLPFKRMLEDSVA